MGIRNATWRAACRLLAIGGALSLLACVLPALGATATASENRVVPPRAGGSAPSGAGVVADPCRLQPTVQQAGGYWPWHDWLYANDYGQLCFYQIANGELKTRAASARRVVFIGDSITQIWKQEDPDFFAGGVVDRGISGQTTSQMLVRFRQDVIDLHPEVVQIMGGTNDIAGNTGDTTLAAIENNIASMADLARAHGIAVVLASVLPASHFFWNPKVKPASAIRALNDWIRAYAAAHNDVYADYYDAMRTPAGGMKAGLSLDGVHPSVAGIRVMDAIAVRAVRAASAGRPGPGTAHR
ncbi:MAG TPA: GDSL-type esterase/lipase family protein [Rhodanobacteraceae bacterium]|nr:GDSL-type esterase/lipase family protein [Rhodanobacteraceae bacterium]